MVSSDHPGEISHEFLIFLFPDVINSIQEMVNNKEFVEDKGDRMNILPTNSYEESEYER